MLDKVRNFLGKLLGLTGGGAVADGHKVYRMLGAQGRQRLNCLAPLVLWLMRVDNGGIEHLAGFVHYRTFHTIAVTRIQADGGTLASRCREQHVAQIGGKDLQRAFLRNLFQPHANVQAGGNIELGAPAPMDGVGKPLGGAIQLEAGGDYVLVVGVIAGI